MTRRIIGRRSLSDLTLKGHDGWSLPCHDLQLLKMVTQCCNIEARHSEHRKAVRILQELQDLKKTEPVLHQCRVARLTRVGRRRLSDLSAELDALPPRAICDLQLLKMMAILPSQLSAQAPPSMGVPSCAKRPQLQYLRICQQRRGDHDVTKHD